MHTYAFIADVTIPFEFGIPQIVLLIIGLGGLALLAHVLHQLAVGQRDPLTGKRQRRLLWGRGISALILLFLSISLIYLAVLLQTYFALTSSIKVATVRATTIANLQHEMSVDLTLYDKHGNITSRKTLAICGDEWELQGDIVKFAAWTNLLGLHTGYKLTRLEGRYDDPNLERNAKHCLEELNGGDDNFFKTLHDQGGWLKPVVEASYGNAVILPADGITYDICVSQTGLFPCKQQAFASPDALTLVALTPLDSVLAEAPNSPSPR